MPMANGEPHQTFLLTKPSFSKSNFSTGRVQTNRANVLFIICKNKYRSLIAKVKLLALTFSRANVASLINLYYVLFLVFAGDDITDPKDGGILLSKVVKGEGYKTPKDGAKVEGMS